MTIFGPIISPTTPVQTGADNGKAAPSAPAINHLGLQMTLAENGQSASALCSPEKAASAPSPFDALPTLPGPSQHFLKAHTVALLELELPFLKLLHTSTMVRLTDEFKENFKKTFNEVFAKQPAELSKFDALKSAGQTAKEIVTKLFMTLSPEHAKYATLMKQFEQTVDEQKSESVFDRLPRISYPPAPGMGTYASMKAALAELPVTPTAPRTEMQQQAAAGEASLPQYVTEAVAPFAAALAVSVLNDALASHVLENPAEASDSALSKALADNQLVSTQSRSEKTETSSESETGKKKKKSRFKKMLGRITGKRGASDKNLINAEKAENAIPMAAPKQPAPVVPSTTAAVKQATSPFSPLVVILTEAERSHKELQEHMHGRYMELVEDTVQRLGDIVRTPEGNLNVFKGETVSEEMISAMEVTFITSFDRISVDMVVSGANDWTAEDYRKVTSSATTHLLSEIIDTDVHRYASYVCASLNLTEFDTEAAKADYESFTPTAMNSETPPPLPTSLPPSLTLAEEADYATATPSVKTSAASVMIHQEKIKARWNEAARKVRKPPPSPTSLPPEEDQIEPLASKLSIQPLETPMAAGALPKPPALPPVIRNNSANVIKALDTTRTEEKILPSIIRTEMPPRTKRSFFTSSKQPSLLSMLNGRRSPSSVINSIFGKPAALSTPASGEKAEENVQLRPFPKLPE